MNGHDICELKLVICPSIRTTQQNKYTSIVNHMMCWCFSKRDELNSLVLNYLNFVADTLDKAAHVVAKGISSDWPALYRKLPFYPPRGERVLDDDVDYVVQEQYRTNDAVKATDSLQRWRRMHTRANLTDLKGTLKDMGRADIVDQINESAKPKVKVKPKAKRRWRHYKNVKVAMDKLKGFQPSVGLTYPRISIRMVQQAQMLTASPMQKNDNTAVAVRRWGMGLKLPKLTDTKTGILNGGD